MSTKKKDLEIIFNLQWKYGPKVAERSNIVGVYDIPSTTLSWEPFKSYILKNSGTPGDDVKVFYMKDGKECPIESTLDFQTALYSFRKMAMNGEIINLKLERISTGTKSNRLSPTSDAQTECTYDCRVDTAPEWFVSYMTEFKKEVLSEVASLVTTHTAAIRSSVSHSQYPRKSKTECQKRCRKNHHHDGNEKEVMKTMKMEKKLESKMEKLVNKSKKLKEKKMSLITKSSDSDAGHSSSKSNSESVLNVDISAMNAAPLRCEEPKVPHFMGGEVYRHCWKVINSGMVPWTSDTELHFSWGSSLLQPIQKIIPCPPLNPMEVGEIEALIHVPKICGKYQMYWHFYHKGRKFGQWLGCEIIVDKINPSEQFSQTYLKNLQAKYETPQAAYNMEDLKPSYGSLLEESPVITIDQTVVEKSQEDLQNQTQGYADSSSTPIPPNSTVAEIEEIVINRSPSKIQIDEHYMYGRNSVEGHTWELDSDDNWKLVKNLSINDDDAGVESRSESISKIDEDATSNSTLHDMVMVNYPDEQEDGETSGYAYVVIDGVKRAIPKKYLRADFLETAEDAPAPDVVIHLKRHEQETVEKFLGLELCNINQNAETFDENPIDDDDDCYDDVPDLVPSSSTDCFNGPEIVNHTVERPLFHFKYVKGLDIFGTSNMERISSDFEGQIVKVINPQPINPETIFLEGKDMVNGHNDFPIPHVPNYQQTPIELRPKVMIDSQESSTTDNKIEESSSAKPIDDAVGGASKVEKKTIDDKTPVADIPSSTMDAVWVRSVPEASVPITSVMSEAMTMASTALKTVVNKIIPSKNEPENSIREKNLKVLADMGFNNRDLNATLLARYDDDIRRVVAELVQ